MRPFEDYNPIVISMYFLSVIGILMLSQNPILLFFGFIGAVFYFVMKGVGGARAHALYLVLFTILSLINPLVSHNGKTVLFFVNNAPVTLEAAVYGAVNSGALVTALYFFASFSKIMTRDKLLYVFGRLSPKLALVLSMGLRYVPLFKDRARRIGESQRALGLYKEDNLFDKIKGDLRVFSILITWALENGITTADSMAARGYGERRRTYYSIFRFGRADIFMLVITLVCTSIILIGLALGTVDFTFYPTLQLASVTPLGTVTYAAYGILVMLPVFTETGDRIRWRYLQSKI